MNTSIPKHLIDLFCTKKPQTNLVFQIFLHLVQNYMQRLSFTKSDLYILSKDRSTPLRFYITALTLSASLRLENLMITFLGLFDLIQCLSSSS